MGQYNRISARRGQDVNLDATFYLGGRRTDPWAVYRVEIYRGSVAEENLVDIVEMADPSGTAYPSPLVRPPDPQPTTIVCPAPPDCEPVVEEASDPNAGRFRLVWNVPPDAVVPDVYFDVWYYFAYDPGVTDLSEAEDALLHACNRFWVYPDDWYVDGGLDTIRFGFEPLDIKFKKPESRPLEVGLMPQPLYDYNYNLVAPIIPYVEPRISIWTENNEPVIANAVCQMKLRQGAFRSNPWVVSYQLNTCNFFVGTYRYRVTLILPDGSTRTSGDFYFTVS